MTEILNITVVLLVFVLLIRRKCNVGYVLLIASAMLFALYKTPIVQIWQTAWKTMITPVTFELVITLTFIRMIEMILRKENALQEMMNTVKAMLKKRKYVLMLIPFIVGMLPSIGGAYFSCPLVEEAATNTTIDKNKRAFINYWFRHPWELFSPVYPGVILASAITGIGMKTFMLMNAVYGLAMLVFGLLAGMNGIAGNYAVDKKPTLKDTINFLPIVLLFCFVIFFGISLSYSIVLVVIGMLLFYRYNLKKVIAVLKYGLAPDVIILIVGVMFFKETLVSTNLVTNLNNYFIVSNTPVISIVMLLPFVAGLLTGLSVGFVSISFPLLLHLPGMDAYSYSLAFAAGFTGVLLSPVHICLVLTRQYFNADFYQMYKKTIPLSLLILITALGEYMLFK
ncbi:MAG: DUF401 family protein [Candidatus Magnetoovum sp. WYHC-5]|nr:DUF401 family protein [Candidatus Magnetoovum sp. WYHC-5]